MRSHLLIVLLFFLPCYLGFSQDEFNKTGGIGFRVDDNQSSAEYNEFAAIFNNYGYKFTFAPNLGKSNLSEDFFTVMRDLQSQGHELADHTPNHKTKYFEVDDTTYYSGKSGVDHIDNGKVYLEYIEPETSYYTGEGLIDINGNVISGQVSSEFSDIFDINSLHAIYIPFFEKIYRVVSKINDETIIVNDFWDDPVNLGNQNSLTYHKLSRYDVHFSLDARKLLAKRTLELCAANNLSNPTCWIQPGGIELPRILQDDLQRSYGVYYNYISGSANPYSIKCFNEYDPSGYKQFSMAWGDFDEDVKDLQDAKETIAEGIAKHYLLIGRSHFSNLLGGWQGYLDRVNSILAWCQIHSIPIRTYSEWTEILYNTPQNPYVNIFPKLEVDLDENQVPDGYKLYSGVDVDNIDGVASSSNHSLKISGVGNITRILELGGIEKGRNSYSMWIKGLPGDVVKVKFYTDYPDISEEFVFSVVNSDWTKYSLSESINGNVSLSFEDSISVVTILITCLTNAGGNLKISGMEMRKYSNSEIILPWLRTPKLNDNIMSLNWEDNSNNEEGFTVKRMIEGQTSFETIGDLPLNSSAFLDSLLNIPDELLTPDSVTIYYKIIAYSESGSSESNVDSIRVLTEGNLPVELSSFTASVTDNTVLLKWRTETETNNFGFEIQRKSGEDFVTIGFVEGHGNSNSQKDYSFIDSELNLAGKYFYRLKQIDNDGTFEYSDVVTVQAGVPNKFSLSQNYPNPFNPETKIGYTLPEQQIVSLRVYNMLGELVQELLNEVKPPGSYSVTFNASKLPSGIYIYRIQTESFATNKKMTFLK